MDWKTFFASIMDSLAWPTAITLVVVFLRHPLAKLIPLLRELKYKDVNLRFGEEAEELADAVDASDPNHLFDLAEGGVELKYLAMKNPQAAVLEAWRQLRWAINDRAKAINPTAVLAIMSTYELAQKYNLVPENMVEVVRGLERLALLAKERGEFLEPDGALHYIASAERAKSALKPSEEGQ